MSMARTSVEKRNVKAARPFTKPFRTATAGLLLMLILVAGSAQAIVRRHDVADARYLVPRASIPALVDLPDEGHGALIAPRWVVTAAHAIKAMQAMPEDRYVTIGGKRREVAKIIVYPNYQASSEAWKALFAQLKSGDAIAWKKHYDDAMASMHDIALLELKQPVDDVPAMPFYRGSDEAGKLAEIYGAGATGTDLSGAPDNAPHRGALRRAENRITDAKGPWLRYVFDCGTSALPLEGVIAGGDSGGPLLIEVNGKWVLAGLAHGLDGSLEDVSRTRSGNFRLGVCGQTFASTRVAFYAGWIDETMRSEQ
jgi:hypothetical protein